MTPTAIISDPRRQAALLYWQGYSMRQIAETLKQKTLTVQIWKRRDAWDNVAPISRVESSMEARLIQLIMKEAKGNGDYKEINALGRQIERHNAFAEMRRNNLGKPLRLETSPAKFPRKGIAGGVYWFVNDWKEPHEFAAGSVFHLLEPDINQELYGLPEYLSALNSVWLNEAATLFRRKYYQNGAHAGYIPLHDRRGAEQQRR